MLLRGGAHNPAPDPLWWLAYVHPEGRAGPWAYLARERRQAHLGQCLRDADDGLELPGGWV
jgi:hypothetical protein